MKKINEHVDSSLKEQVEEEPSNRRKFLKKAVYGAPVLMALGQLVKPEKAIAGGSEVEGTPVWN